MNAFQSVQGLPLSITYSYPQPGTRDFFWTSSGAVEYAIVQSTNRLPDVRVRGPSPTF